MSGETIRVTDRQGVHGTIERVSEDYLPEARDRIDLVPLTLPTGAVVHIDRSKLILREDDQYLYNGTIPMHTTAEDEDAEEYRFPLAQEELTVRRETRETGRVRISKKVVERIEHIDEPVIREVVDIQRIPVGRVVDGPVPVRQEGEVLIIPVLEERVVIKKELVLMEELHVRKFRSERHEEQEVTLRSEEAVVERRPADKRS